MQANMNKSTIENILTHQKPNFDNNTIYKIDGKDVYIDSATDKGDHYEVICWYAENLIDQTEPTTLIIKK